jgi:hypothetical protein
MEASVKFAVRVAWQVWAALQKINALQAAHSHWAIAARWADLRMDC